MPSKKKRKTVHNVDSDDEGTEIMEIPKPEEEFDVLKHGTPVIKDELGDNELIGQAAHEDEDELEDDEDGDHGVGQLKIGEERPFQVLPPPPKEGKKRELQIPMFRYGGNPIASRAVVNAPSPGKRSAKAVAAASSSKKPQSSGSLKRGFSNPPNLASTSRGRNDGPQPQLPRSPSVGAASSSKNADGNDKPLKPISNISRPVHPFFFAVPAAKTKEAADDRERSRSRSLSRQPSRASTPVKSEMTEPHTPSHPSTVDKELDHQPEAIFVDLLNNPADTADEEEGVQMQMCPICTRELGVDNAGLNAHVDWCLSKGVIMEATSNRSTPVTQKGKGKGRLL